MSIKLIKLAIICLLITPAYAQNGIGYSYPKPIKDKHLKCFQDAPWVVPDGYYEKCLEDKNGK